VNAYRGKPLAELFDDPADAVNVIANCSFELTGESGELVGWQVLEGNVSQGKRDGTHAARLSGRIRSNRFELSAIFPYEITGEACGRLVGKIHFMEHDRYLRSERFVSESDGWTAFMWRFIPPPNAERAELELIADDALVDDLYLDGLGAQDYQILDMQSGYHPASEKRVIVRSRTEIGGDIRWELVDTLRGLTAADGVLEVTGQDIWKRWTGVADFTACEREGNYLLRVHLPDRIVESAAIRIWNGVYRRLGEIVAKYSYLQRCGVDIPGYHKACHTNDAFIRATEEGDNYGQLVEYRDMTGGWHDAGDYNKWFHYFGYVLETLALMQERLGYDRITYGENVPDVLSEVFWGADFFLKVQNPDGSFLGAICGWYAETDEATGRQKNSPWAIFWEKPHEDSGGGELMHPRTRGVTYDDALPSPAQVLDYATALAMSARAAKGVDDRRCYTYVNAALKSVGWLLGEEPKLAEHPYFVTLWYALYKATGNEGYRRKAFDLIPVLLKRESQDTPFGVSGGLKHPFHVVTAMLELLVDEPDHPMRDAVLSATGRFLDWMKQFTLDEQYGLILQPNKGTPPNQLNVATMGRNAYTGNVAYVYALAGRLTGNRDWLHVAERQIAWLTGRNPHGVCQVTDAGRVHPARYHGWHNHNDNDLGGALTGGIINGIKVPDESANTGDTWSIMPPRFPILSVRRTDVPYAEHDMQNARHDTNEYWSLHHAAFHEAVSALAAAYEEFNAAARPKACVLYSNAHGYEFASRFDGLLERLGWEADRTASDLRYPGFDTRAYAAIIVDPSWSGVDYLDAGGIGITVRDSFLKGVPWILVNPSEACESWLQGASGGLVPYGEVEPAESGWGEDEFGRVRQIHNSAVHAVSDEAALAGLLKHYAC